MDKHQPDLFADGGSYDLSILTISPDPVLVTDLFGVISTCNKAASELFDSTVNNLIGRSIEEFISIDYYDPLISSLEQVYLSNPMPLIKTQLEAEKISGGKVDIGVHATFTEIDSQIYAVVSIRDLSRQRSIEKSLAQTERIFQQTIEQLAVGACHLTLDGHFKFANRNLLQFLGMKNTELLGKSFSAVMHPEDAPIFKSRTQQLIAGTIDSYKTELRYRHAVDHYIWAQVTLSLIHDEHGGADHFLAIIEDINSRKIFEKLIRESELKFRTIVESLSEESAVCILNSEHTIIQYVNQGFEQIWGRSSDYLYNTPVSCIGLVHPEDKAGVLSHFKNINHTSDQIDYRIIRDDGELRYIRQRHYEIVDEEELQFMIIVATDVTKDVVQRLELQEALSSLKEANEKLTILSRTDPLTQLVNRQAIQEEVYKELHRFKRYKIKSTLIFIDLMDFKLVNDKHGHLAGDKALQACANHLNNCTRSTDLVGRYGGDEFIILLPNTGIKEATIVARKLQNFALNFSYEDKIIPIKMSVGISETSEEFPDEVTWLKSADYKMYKNKHSLKALHA